MSLTQPQSQETSLVGRIVTSNVDTTSATIYARFEDKKTGEARTPQSTTKVFVLSKDTERFEIIFADSHVTADGITTITVNASGRGVLKYGNLSGSASGNRHPINSEIGCAETHLPLEILNEIIRGNEGTGSASFRIGIATDVDITLYAQNADASKPFIRYSAVDNKWLMSNNGVDTYDPQAGGSGVTAGDGISLTAGDLDIDMTDTVIFRSVRNGNETRVPITLLATGKIDTSFITAGLLASYISDVTATAAEINTPLDGVSANVTAVNLNALTGGGDASALHSHSASTQSYTAYEAVTADQALALLPVQVEYYSQLTEAGIALGDNNARRKYAVKFYPTRTPNFTTLAFRGKESGTSTALITLTIETDNAGAPSGTAVTNGTAAALDSSSWTSTYASRTATFPGVPTMVADTAYWLVFSTSNTDAANYVVIGQNATYDENYITFERQTYDLGTASWGGSVTNATPFFWTVSEEVSLGVAVVPTDANWGGRTWPFIGFASANADAQASVSVYYDTVPNLSSLVPNGSPYYLSATIGAITTTPPGTMHTNGTVPTAYTYKIGRAISTTDLKIELGQKRVVITDSGLTATTTRQYITWFQPEIIRVSGSGSGNPDSAISSGIALGGGNNAMVQMAYINGGAGIASGGATNSIDTGANADYFTAVSSAITNVGFTYTYTESGTANVWALLEAIQ